MTDVGIRRLRTNGGAKSNWSKSLAITTTFREELSPTTTVSTTSPSLSSDSEEPGQINPSINRRQQHRLGISPGTTTGSHAALVTPTFDGDDESDIGTATSNVERRKDVTQNTPQHIITDSSVATSPVRNTESAAKERSLVESQMSHPPRGMSSSQQHQPFIKKKISSEWAIPKWKELESKRLALCQQRAHLERRLFEFSESTPRNHMSLQSQSFKDLENDTRHKSISRSSVSSTASQSSTTSSDFVIDSPKKNPDSPSCDDSVSTPGGIDTNNAIVLRRFQLRDDQDPVLWSGSVNRKNQPEGVGRMVFSDGQIYEGAVKAGQREGKGVNVWPNGQIYTGSWSQNSRSGRGTHRWPDGRIVTGPWLNGHLHGRVFFKWPDGATYDGDTVKGQKEGRGIHTWKDGRVYSGQYRNGSENGFGTLTERSQKTKYRGQFKDGKRHGYGMQIWKNKTYDGEWVQNMIHGRGKLTWLSGACYTGEFIEGRYHGTGTYRSESGTKYVGQWVDGYKHGQGSQYWTDGRIYKGTFHKNRRHGYGQMTFPDGTIYTGGWEHGKRAGHGIEVIVIVDGVSGETTKTLKHCGLWKHDEAVMEDAKTQARLKNRNKLELNYGGRILDESVDDLHLVLKKTKTYSDNYDNPVVILDTNALKSFEKKKKPKKDGTRSSADSTEEDPKCESHLIFF